MLQDMFTSGWLGIAIASIIVIVLIGVVGLIALGIFHACDSWFLPKQQAPGIIKGRSHTPAHWQPITTSMPNGSGGTNTTVTLTYIPACWSVTVQMGNRFASMSCTEQYYNSAEQDKPVTVHYVDGRFSSKFYIRALS